MKITIEFEHKKLKKKLTEAEEQVKYWRNQFSDNHKKNKEWCDRATELLEKTMGGDCTCLDTLLMKLVKEYIALGGKKIPYGDSMTCTNKDCRLPLSNYWKFCPECGSLLKKTH